MVHAKAFGHSLMAWSALVIKFWSHSLDATCTPMSFMEELVLKVNLEDPFFTRRYLQNAESEQHHKD
jgi:hypothetical protein